MSDTKKQDALYLSHFDKSFLPQSAEISATKSLFPKNVLLIPKKFVLELFSLHRLGCPAVKFYYPYSLNLFSVFTFPLFIFQLIFFRLAALTELVAKSGQYTYEIVVANSDELVGGQISTL